jgi:hypothetical protein
VQRRHIHRADTVVVELPRDLLRKSRLALGDHQMSHGADAPMAVDKAGHAPARPLIITRKDGPLPVPTKLIEVAQAALLEIGRQISHIPRAQLALDPP